MVGTTIIGSVMLTSSVLSAIGSPVASAVASAASVTTGTRVGVALGMAVARGVAVISKPPHALTVNINNTRHSIMPRRLRILRISFVNHSQADNYTLMLANPATKP
jgi:hypothetical protein